MTIKSKMFIAATIVFSASQAFAQANPVEGDMKGATPGDPIPGIEIVVEQGLSMNGKSCAALDDDDDGDSVGTSSAQRLQLEGVRDVCYDIETQDQADKKNRMNKGELIDAMAKDSSAQNTMSEEVCDSVDNNCDGINTSDTQRKIEPWNGTYKGKRPSATISPETDLCFADGQEVTCPNEEPTSTSKREVRKFKKMEKLPYAEAEPLEPIEEIDE